MWVLSNKKEQRRKGKVQLIDASSFWIPMRKSLGDKRREIPTERAQDIIKLLTGFRDGETRKVTKDGKEEEVVVSKVFPTTHFGFRKVTVERPLRLNLQASPERLARLEDERGFQGLAQSKKKGAAGKAEEEKGRELQKSIRRILSALPSTLFKNRADFDAALDAAARKAGIKLASSVRKAIHSALSERDETAEICRDADGNPEPDPELRDFESVPIPPGDDPVDAEGVTASVRAFFEREVKPHVPDAWIDTDKRDEKDGRVGVVGYEINFNKYFYRYTPPRPLEEIEADIRTIEGDIVRMLGEVANSVDHS